MQGYLLLAQESRQQGAPITRGDVELLVRDAEYGRAQQLAERMLEQARAQSGEESLGAADAMQMIAEARRRGTRTHEPETLALAESALRIKKRRLGAGHEDVAECLHQLGMLHFKRGEWELARLCLRQAWTIREKRLGPDDPAVGQSLMVYGGLLLTETTDEALALLDRARVIQEDSLDPSDPDIARRMMFQAYVHHTRGELDAALELYQRALVLLERTLRPEHPTFATVHRDLGLLAHGSSDYAGARPHYEKALSILESNYGERSRRVAELLRLLAEVDVLLGNSQVARRRYLRALEILRVEHGDLHLSVAKCSLDLGYLMRARGDLEAAHEHYERALRFVDEGQAPTEFMSECRLHYGAFLHFSGDMDGAREQYEAVRSELSQAAGGPTLHLSWALHNLGFVAYQRGNFSRAHDLIRQAVLILGSSPEARMAPFYAHALIGLSMAEFAIEDRDAALEHALLAERVSRNHLRENSAGLERLLAMSYASIRTTGLDLALSMLLKESDPTAGSRRAVAQEIIRSRGLVFEEMVLRQRAMTTAASASLSSHAQVLRGSIKELSNLLVRGAGGESPEKYRSRIEAAARRKERAESEFARAWGGPVPKRGRDEATPRKILEALPDGSALVAYYRFRRDPMAGGKPGHSWGAESTLKDSYAVLVMSKGAAAPIVLGLGNAEEIDGLIFGWRRFTAHGAAPVASMRRAGESLRRRIWDPVAAHLKGVERVFVVPDQALHLVNLVSLPTEDNRFLLETGPLIHYLSAERDLLQRHLETERGTGLLIVGGVAFDGSDPGSGEAPEGGDGRRPPQRNPNREEERIPQLARQFRRLTFPTLPSSETEAVDIAALWNANLSPNEPERRALLLLGRDASEGGFKKLAPGKRVLHLATHGFFLDGQRRASDGRRRRLGEPVAVGGEQGPMRPRLSAPDSFPLLCTGLALSGANQRSTAPPEEEDGILTAEEIVMLDLGGVELAVLSACDTGLGQVQAGEGVFDLRRAFELAGVEKVIMSLWQVDDRIAEHWMKRFYSSWRERQLSIPHAARSASLSLLKERRARRQSTHPHFWATFVALGN